jgi:hypothetical protein
MGNTDFLVNAIKEIESHLQGSQESKTVLSFTKELYLQELRILGFTYDNGELKNLNASENRYSEVKTIEEIDLLKRVRALIFQCYMNLESSIVKISLSGFINIETSKDFKLARIFLQAILKSWQWNYRAKSKEDTKEVSNLEKFI